MAIVSESDRTAVVVSLESRMNRRTAVQPDALCPGSSIPMETEMYPNPLDP
jgi:hypothetical protein